MSDHTKTHIPNEHNFQPDEEYWAKSTATETPPDGYDAPPLRAPTLSMQILL